MSVTNIIDLALIMRSLIGIGYTEQEASAFYGNYTTLAVPMFNLAISLVTPISIAFLPIFTRARVSCDDEMLSASLLSSLRLSAIISAPILIGMTLFSREILSLLFGNSGIEIGATLLCLLAPAIFFSSVLLSVNSALEAGGQVRTPVISMIFGGAAKILVSYFLLTNSEFGISGAPIGTVVSYAVALAVSGIIYISKTSTSIPILKSSALPYLSSFVAVGASRLLYLNCFSELNATLSLGFSVAIAALIYAILLVFTGTLRPLKLEKQQNVQKWREKIIK